MSFLVFAESSNLLKNPKPSNPIISVTSEPSELATVTISFAKAFLIVNSLLLVIALLTRSLMLCGIIFDTCIDCRNLSSFPSGTRPISKAFLTTSPKPVVSIISIPGILTNILPSTSTTSSIPFLIPSFTNFPT